MSTNIEQLIARIDELRLEVKNTNAELKTSIESTPMYTKILTSTMKQATGGCVITDKMAQAHALKVTLANYKKTLSGPETLP